MFSKGADFTSITSIIKEVPDAFPLTHQIGLLHNPGALGLSIGHLGHVHPLTLLHLNQCLNPSKHEWLVSHLSNKSKAGPKKCVISIEY